jgi:hypothetical protein
VGNLLFSRESDAPTNEEGLSLSEVGGAHYRDATETTQSDELPSVASTFERRLSKMKNRANEAVNEAACSGGKTITS